VKKAHVGAAPDVADPLDLEDTSNPLLLALAHDVATRFHIPEPVRTFEFPDRGNINRHTYLVHAGSTESPEEYLLQRINERVFTRPRSVMASMMAAISAQRESLANRPIQDCAEWHPVTLIQARDGGYYTVVPEARGQGVWRLMVKIPGARTYKSLSQITSFRKRMTLAEEAGRGLAIYCDLTCDMDVSGLESPLPGYRDTRLYYDQLNSVLAGCRTNEQSAPFLPEDELLLQSAGRHFLVHLPQDEYKRRRNDPDLKRFIDLALRKQEFALTLLRAMETGRIRRLAIHGDTKLDNFLFCTRSGHVKALVDLDTIMPHTWLVDWGDMVRSLVNVAGEKEPNLACVDVDLDIYRAIARGFLRCARRVTPEEVELMPDAVEIIALELGVRFLADYLRGDTYFSVGAKDPPDLNRTRAMAQLTLFERLQHHRLAADRCIAALRGTAG
jgi:hypothetical protein